MPSRQINPEQQPFFPNMQFGDPKTLLAAQEATWETMAQLGHLTYNYATELNKTWFGLCRDQLDHLAAWPQRLAKCHTPEEVVKAHADLIGDVTKDYKEGFDRLAAASEGIARDTGKAVNIGQAAVSKEARHH